MQLVAFCNEMQTAQRCTSFLCFSCTLYRGGSRKELPGIEATGFYSVRTINLCSLL